MVRRILLIVVFLALAACSADAAPPTTSEPVTTTSSIPFEPPRDGLVVDPGLILDAHDSGVLDSLEADVLLATAAFAGPDTVPFEYLAEASIRPQWDHSATTRLVERWDELDGEVQIELINEIDGLQELVGRPGLQGIRANRGTDGCIPVGPVDVWICVGASIAQSPVPSLMLDEAAAVVRPWVRDAAIDSWTKFESLFGAEPRLVKVFLSNLTASGGYTYGVVPEEPPESDGGICHLYVDVMIPEETDPAIVSLGDGSIPDGVPVREQIQATIAHELFHCFQRVNAGGFTAVLWEGSATWSEHHVYPQFNTELPWMASWVSDPDKPFETRLYDSSFGFLYAEQHGGDPQAVVDVLTANSVASLGADFPSLWHAVSVAAWNAAPVEPLINDGGALIDAEVGDVGVYEITAEADESMDFLLDQYSRDIQTFEFLGGVDEQSLIDFARLNLDLSSVPDDIRITALPETNGGWLEPVELSGDSWQFCRAAIGACNEVEAIHPYSRIVLIVTNVDNGIETFSIPWDTYNPHLHGTWVRTQGPLMTAPGITAPYSIVGTQLGFDEPAAQMTETTDGYTLTNVEPGWECTFAGSYVVGAAPSYDTPQMGDVSGTVTIDGVGDGETFTNDCVFNPSGFETQLSGLHIPVAASPTQTFGFEIRNYDTVWIYAYERIYVYERVGE